MAIFFDFLQTGKQFLFKMPIPDQPVTLRCPAKVNLSLAILGRRDDGFHALHSVVTQTSFADELSMEWIPGGGPENDSVTIRGAALPALDNSVRQAITAFRRVSGFTGGHYTATLSKRIPLGAGLGGGSSDAVSALKALRQLHAHDSLELDWEALAAELGSDCPLFLKGHPVVMEGRGERITALDPELASRFRGKEILLFKPRFSIGTAEAYRRLAAARLYQPADRVDSLMTEWKASSEILPPRINDFERLLEVWMPSLAILLHRLRKHHGLDARLSGSGSACFAFSPDVASAKSRIDDEAKRAWGESCWIEEAVLN